MNKTQTIKRNEHTYVYISISYCGSPNL